MRTRQGRSLLRLRGEAAALLAKKAAVLTLKTRYGQYRLPLAEVVRQGSEWASDADLQITIGLGSGEPVAGLQAAASNSGISLVSDPVQFDVHVMRQGESKELASFKQYVERIIYLPTGFTGKASTAVVWDKKLGLRPVPTKFMTVDGHQAAVIRSLTNSTYMLVSGASSLTDIQGHWAAAAIGEMNRRLIVQGVDGSRFAP